MFKFINNIRNYFAQEKARREKLELMFQEGKQVRSVATGKVYDVLCSELCYALLKGPSGKMFTVDWMTPAGTIRTEVADCWNPVIA